VIAAITIPDTRPDRSDGQPFPDSPAPAGLYHLPALPAGLVTDAQRAIAAWLSVGFPNSELDHLPHAERMRRYTDDSHGDRTLRESAPIQRIFTYYDPIVRRVVGADAWRGLGVQIALRMPGEGGVRHIDGIASADPGDPRIPNAVLGVYLSDVGEHDGAFAVWPQLRDDLRRYGARLQNDSHADDDRQQYKEIIEGLNRDIPPHVVTGGAGAAFLVHGGLPHRNITNLGTGIRYALFARYYRDDTYPYGFDADNAGRAWDILANPDQAWAMTAGPALISTRRTVRSWEEFAETVAGGWAVAFHCGQPGCEDDIRTATSAGPRCLPTEEPAGERLCVRCGQPSEHGKWLVCGRKY
jgi:hypothetical protein